MRPGYSSGRSEPAKDHDLQPFTHQAKAAELACDDGQHHQEVVAQTLGL